MKVICDSIGSVPGECIHCTAARSHSIEQCEKCSWNKEAKCVPVIDNKKGFLDSVLTGKDLDEIDQVRAESTLSQVCTKCGSHFKGNVPIPICPTCYA